MPHLVLILFFVFSASVCSIENEFCDASDRERTCYKNKSGLIVDKYIFYDVNPPEGFNLRRDVYMRMAIFVRKLRKDNWFLVLPPWPHLYHWHGGSQQSRFVRFQDPLSNSCLLRLQVVPALPDSLSCWFKNTELEHILRRFPCERRVNLFSFSNVKRSKSKSSGNWQLFKLLFTEMQEFFQTGQKVIDQVFVLQHFEDTFTAGNFNDRMKLESCQEHLPYERSSKGYLGDFWGYQNVTAKTVKCLSFHGPASQLLNIIKKTEANTVMFDHAEITLHDRFGDKTYWDARKSMKFANHLIEEATRFRKNTLNSTNDEEGTAWPNGKRSAVGGSYMCVHLRRKDFLRGRSKEVPSIQGAAAQIEKTLRKLNLEVLFVATDASEEEKTELKLHLKNYKLVTYNPSEEIKSKYKDGGIAIIEQIICSHARVFVGTHESTFSFRIQEEREIMGFQPETTFNRLCGDKETNCRPPSKWLIVR